MAWKPGRFFPFSLFAPLYLLYCSKRSFSPIIPPIFSSIRYHPTSHQIIFCSPWISGRKTLVFFGVSCLREYVGCLILFSWFISLGQFRHSFKKLPHMCGSKDDLAIGHMTIKVGNRSTSFYCFFCYVGDVENDWLASGD